MTGEITQNQKPDKCPACGSNEVTEILYGRPTEKAIEAAERSEITLGGCIVKPERWSCGECKYKWHHRDESREKAWMDFREEYIERFKTLDHYIAAALHKDDPQVWERVLELIKRQMAEL